MTQPELLGRWGIEVVSSFDDVHLRSMDINDMKIADFSFMKGVSEVDNITDTEDVSAYIVLLTKEKCDNECTCVILAISDSKVIRII